MPFRRSGRARGALLALPLLAVLAAPALPGSASAAEPTDPVEAPAAAPPNIVLVVTDDQTMATMKPEYMPYLFQQKWVQFPNAIVENALCCPSRATIITGQYDSRTGVSHNGQVSRFNPNETLATALQRRGYTTGLIGKYLNEYDGLTVPPGWDEWQVPYSTTLYNQYRYPLSRNGVREWRGESPADHQVEVLTSRSEAFISRTAQQGDPFFLMFAPTVNHTPWKASPTHEGRYASEPVTWSAAFNEKDVSDKPRFIKTRPLRDPAAMTANRRKEFAAARTLDDSLRRLDTSLRAAGVYDNTAVVFMTDNGYALGEHRWLTKRCQYEECIRTPMLVRYPGAAAKSVPRLISNIDITPTILAMAGASTTRTVDGKSFLPYVTGSSSPTWRTGALIHWPGGNTTGQSGKPDSIPQYWGVRTVKDKYVELDTGEREYYDLVGDPYELVNQAANPAYATRVQALKSQLATLKRQAGASAFPPNTSMPAPGELGPDVD